MATKQRGIIADPDTVVSLNKMTDIVLSIMPKLELGIKFLSFSMAIR